MTTPRFLLATTTARPRPARRVALVALVAWMLAVPGFARRSADDPARELESLQALVDAAEGPASRDAAFTRLLERRASLIDELPAHPRRAWWIADQVEDLLLQRLGRDGTTLTMLVGLPTPAQREACRATLVQIDALSSAAASTLDAATRRVAADGSLDDVARREQLRVLADLREGRLATLDGMAAVLGHAAGEVDVARLREAAAALQTLAGRTGGPTAARLRAWSGVAWLRTGDPQRARDCFEPVRSAPEAHAADRFLADVGDALAGASSGPAAAVERVRALERRYRAASEAFYRLLLADQQVRLDLGPDLEGARDPLRLASAIEPYRRLLADAGPDDHAALLAAVLARLAPLADAGEVAVERWPPLVVLAVADTLERAGRHAEAVSRYQRVVTSDRVDDAAHAAAMLGLGRVLYESSRPDDAARAWAALARRHPADGRAERAIELAATVAVARFEQQPEEAARRTLAADVLDLLLARFPDLGSTSRWRLAAGRVALADGRGDDAAAHAEAIGRDADEWIDACCLAFAAARQAWDEAEGAARIERAEAVLARAALALEAIDRVPADGRRSLAARRGRVQAETAEALLELARVDEALRMLGPLEDVAGLPPEVAGTHVRLRLRAGRESGRLDAALAEIEHLVRAAPSPAAELLVPVVRRMSGEVERLLAEGRDEQAVRRVKEELAPLTDLLIAALGSGDAGPPDASRVLAVADAMLMTGRTEEALRRYEQLLEADPDALPYLRGRAECLFALGGDGLAEAIGLYKRIATLGPERGGDDYWRAQTRTLQILGRVGRNTQRIAPQVERLRRLDPELGGTRWRRALEALERKYSLLGHHGGTEAARSMNRQEAG